MLSELEAAMLRLWPIGFLNNLRGVSLPTPVKLATFRITAACILI